MRRFFRIFGLGVAIFAILGLLVSLPVVGSYEGKAVTAQRVEADKAASIFDDGEAYREIGSPQALIIDDPKAFLPPKAGSTVKRVDEAYLKAHNIYPLQLQTVHFVAGMTRIGLAIAAIIGGLIALLARRRRA